jgi:hypothetical protein
MVVMNKSLFLKSALDSNYKCSSIRVSDRRWFTSCETTRVQEIENYGTTGQHALAEGEGEGFIWRLFSITRFEERDGGVYIELEAIASHIQEFAGNIPSTNRARRTFRRGAHGLGYAAWIVLHSSTARLWH